MTDQSIDNDDAIKLERAALLILRVVKASRYGGSAWLRASVHQFPDLPDADRRRISLAAARETLDMTKAWKEAK